MTTHSTFQLPLADFSCFDDLPLGLVRLSGNDNKSYLQGQLTCDINQLSSEHSVSGAHCDAKGKMQAFLRLFQYGDDILAVHDKSHVSQHLPELKKYAVFSKVDIIDDTTQWQLLGFSGTAAGTWLQQRFGQLPDDNNCLSLDNGVLHHLADGRWLLMLTSDSAGELREQLPAEAVLYGGECWNALDILAGQPLISGPSQQEYVPQMLNLQMIDAINFSKGCYTGQETVARMHYRGLNKRAMYILTLDGTVDAAIGDAVEKAAGDSWRAAGTLVNISHGQSDTTLVLAVLPADLDDDLAIRLKNSGTAARWSRPDYWQLTQE